MLLQQLGQLVQGADSSLAVLSLVDTPIAIAPLAFNLLIGALLSLVLRWHYRRFASTLSNREAFLDVFPFILLTTLLIITVVKSSLALSLGLVGALSVVRFRTPIKEPEELAYLFLAIAIGLGLGANQTLSTVFATLTILAVVALLKAQKQQSAAKNLFLSIDWNDNGSQPPGVEKRLEVLNDLITQHTVRSDLRRFDVRDHSFEATYLVDIENEAQLTGLIDRLRQDHPGIGITFIDQHQLPGA